MLWRQLDQQKILKRFMVIYIAGFIAALCAFVSVAQALELIKPNPSAGGTFITEPETCNNLVGSSTPGEYDTTDSNGVRYWQRTSHVGNDALYFYQSGTVPGCTDDSAIP